MDRADVVPGAAAMPLLIVWVSWILGPACFALCAALNDGEPNCLLALLAVVGHGTAVALTLMMTASARFRRLPEYWLMIIYWVPLACLFLSMRIESFPLARASMFTILGWVTVVPFAGAVRLILMLRRVASRE